MSISFTVDQDYIVSLRREIHMYPELGWDLDRTTQVVRRELDKLGIPYDFEKYGRNTVVATLGKQDADFTIGIRADMDALPIQEKESDCPFRSRTDGQMHACGHDAHTAMLLGAAKALKEIESQLLCRVRLLFQPCEESKPSGAMVMCQHGVMDDIDCIIMCHVNCVEKTGTVNSCSGITNATSCAFEITTHGTAAHVAAPHLGKDALAMAVKIYNGLQFLISREVDPFDTCVLGVGVMEAGKTIAQVPDFCEMRGSMRCLKESTRDHMQDRIRRLVDSICTDMGGTGEVHFNENPLPPAYNDDRMYRMFLQSARKVTDQVAVLEPSPGGEDFAYYEKKKPGLLFGLGLRNEAIDCCHPAHSPLWQIDESGLHVGSEIFVQFVLDHMATGRQELEE